jgi:hypothetical protein
MTATERLYRQWLQASDEHKPALEKELAAICIAACRKSGLAPPFEYREDSNGEFWVGGYRSLASWVYRWVADELVRKVPLKDGARFIARRCKNALIDEIRWRERRRRGASIRYREPNDPAERQRLRCAMLETLAGAGLPAKIRIAEDRKLLQRLMDSLPEKVTNVTVARERGVSEGAIRKRRKRIGIFCFRLAKGDYQLQSVLIRLGREFLFV